MNGALNSALIRQNYTEIAAPFIDLDVFEFCMCIPYEKRLNRKIYDKWLLSCYPDAAEIENASSGRKIGASRLSVLKNKISKIPNRIKRIAKTSVDALNVGMNPYVYWWKTDARFREYVQNYFNENINNSNIPDEVKNSIVFVFGDGNAETLTEIYEKLSTVTVLAAVKYYFGE